MSRKSFSLVLKRGTLYSPDSNSPSCFQSSGSAVGGEGAAKMSVDATGDDGNEAAAVVVVWLVVVAHGSIVRCKQAPNLRLISSV